MENMIIGFAIMLLGAICGGSFGLPSKYVKKGTPWEVLWGPFFFFVTILIPTLLGPAIVKDFFGVYSKAGFNAMLMPLVFGLLWGLGSMTLGMSFSFIGLSLAYALNYGAQIATGSMAPMLIHTPGKLCTAQGGVIVAGVVACLVGVVLSGRAAMLKEQSLKASGASPSGDDAKKPKMLIGIIIGIASGVLCACYSVSMSYTGALGKAATTLGNVSWQTSWATMAVAVWGGALSACGYCVVLLTKNKTWGQLAGPGIGTTMAIAFLMAMLHDGAIFCFGLGASYLGALGVTVGYAVFMSFAIIVGNIHGFRQGEWKGASRQSIQWVLAGLAILVVGVCILGYANSMG